MKKICAMIPGLLFVLATGAQDKPYDASKIPEAMRLHAYSVKRDERIYFEVKSPGKAFHRVHKVVTVLNDNGRDELVFHASTDQFKSLESVSIELYDARGNSIRRYKRNDLAKQTAGEGLVPDGQVYWLEPPPQTYPVTISMDYEIVYTGLLNYPDYEVQLPEQSVEQSSFTVAVPPDLDLRFKAKNTALAPVTGGDARLKTYTWSVAGQPALEEEPGSVSYESRYPRILLSPTKFDLDGYAGDMSSWENFGKWYGLLSKDAANLPEDRKQFFRSLVKDAKDDREKVQLIYHYLQSNCRYVLILLGIGGFKPFDANFVDKKKYGDCKALSNYTQACLDAVGVKSHQALINASYNKEPVDPAFPHNSFNHVILCVPLAKDSIWLECTSNTTEPGELGNFTENRNALLITENGGRLVQTPRSKASENTFSSHADIDLAEDGSGIASVVLNTTGEYKQDLLRYFGNQKKDDQKAFLVDGIGYMQPDDFEISYDLADKNAATKMMMSMSKVPEFTAGRKLFLNPRIYKIWRTNLPKSANRTQDFYFEHPFVITDTTVYKLPEGFAVETLPQARNLAFEYGSFTSTYDFDATKKSVRSIARLELDQYKIPAAKFLATKEFFNQVAAEYTEKIVVKKL